MLLVMHETANGRAAPGVPDGRYLTTEEFCIVNGTTNAQVRQWKKRGVLVVFTIFGRNYIPENAWPKFKKRGRPKTKMSQKVLNSSQ